VLGKLVLAAAAEREHDLSSLRYVGFGGDIVPRDMAQRFLAMGVKLRCGGHGMAESLADHTAAFYGELAGADPHAAFTRMLDENSGLPIVGAQVRVVREDGTAVAADGVETGEIQLKGWHVISEYFRDAANTRALFTADGWLRTGDVGVRFADASIAFVGRSKDMIKSGGEWIPSLTLEHALSEHPAVAELCVIGVPHATYGERPLALFTARPGRVVDPAALREYLEDRLPRWMVPDCLAVDDIAKTTVGKFDKALLRERYRAFFARTTAAD
jgi:fatty-acyl-CoA synthase